MIRKSKKYLINTIVFFLLTIMGVLAECGVMQNIHPSMSLSFFLLICLALIFGAIIILSLIVCAGSLVKYIRQKKLEKQISA